MSLCQPRPLFVYGSLMDGLFNYRRYLAHHVSQTPRRARVRGALYHLQHKGYPALLQGEDWVYGELFVLDDFPAAIAALDEMENFHGEDDPQSEYLRQLIEVEIFDPAQGRYVGQQHAYHYRYVVQHDPKWQQGKHYLPDGNWRAFHLAQLESAA